MVLSHGLTNKEHYMTSPVFLHQYLMSHSITTVLWPQFLCNKVGVTMYFSRQ